MHRSRPVVRRRLGGLRKPGHWLVTWGVVTACWPAIIGAQSAEPRDAPFAVPEWPYPLPPRAATSNLAPPSGDTNTVFHVPNSSIGITHARVNHLFDVVDWHPEGHPAMPGIISQGRRPTVIPCGYCHLADGAGRPENAMLAGLSADYLAQQVKDMRSRARKSAWPGTYGPSDYMRAIADSATDAEVAQAAEYFSKLPARVRIRIVETATIPKPAPRLGLYYPAPGGGTEPLGKRLITMPEDTLRHELRDPALLYVTYVPPGSIARGKALATTWRDDGAAPCTSCHGEELHGVGPIPPTAGRFPAYILRQLLAFKTGTRSTPVSLPMNTVAAKLSLDDMIAVAAYEGSLKP